MFQFSFFTSGLTVNAHGNYQHTLELLTQENEDVTFGLLDKPTIGYFGACVGHFKEAGLRLPLDPLLLELMARMSIQFSCLRLNVIRVVLSVSALNKLLNLKLGLNEILYCYKLAPGVSGNIFHFTSYHDAPDLIKCLPSSQNRIFGEGDCDHR